MHALLSFDIVGLSGHGFPDLIEKRMMDGTLEAWEKQRSISSHAGATEPAYRGLSTFRASRPMP
jgi:hypothetical protein